MSATSPFWERMKPLGAVRCRILACLGADSPRLPAFFDPPSNEPLDRALHRHLVKLYEEFAPDPDSQRIVAAGLLSFGELPRADEILSRLPEKPVVLDHGAGWCALIAYSTVAALLPLPDAHRDPKRWIENSADAGALREWFQSHRAQLRWEPSLQQFVLRR